MKYRLLALTLLAACSGNSGPAKEDAQDHSAMADVADSVGGDTDTCQSWRTIGQPCEEDCECLQGTCLLNEWAPFRYCSADCSSLKPGQACPPDPGLGESTSVCIQLKSDFNPEPQRFCVPTCVDGAMSCKTTGNPWETCEPPHYRLVPLMDTTIPVCMAPSAHGHAPIDPATCAGWETLYDAWPEVAETCEAYCLFMDDCRFVPSDTLPACCAFACARYLAPEAAPIPANVDLLQCLIQAWGSYQKTAQACIKPDELCGDHVELQP